MKIFVDTANLAQIEELASLGILDGVTTNPTLLAKEGVAGKQARIRHYQKICELVNGDVSAEVLSTTYEEMLREAQELASIHPSIVVKIPMTEAGLQAIRTLKSQNIRTNCTLVFSGGQALLAAKAGAYYVSPFIGRLDDRTQSGIQTLQEIVEIYRNYQFSTQVLAASIRSPLHVVQCALIGVDAITAPYKVLKELVRHPLTDLGLEKFLSDYRAIEAASETKTEVPS